MADDLMMQTIMGALEPPTPEPVAAVTPATVPATPSEPAPVIRDTQEPAVEETAAPEEGVTVTEDLDAFGEAQTPEQLFKGITDPNTPQLQQAWDAYKFAKQLAKAPEEGGIGHEPTVEDIKIYHADHVWVENVMGDFEANPVRFVEGMSRVNPIAMAQVIEIIPDAVENIAEAAPEVRDAYYKLSNKIASSLVENLLDKAIENENRPDLKKWFFGLARNLQYFLTDGKVQLDEKTMRASAAPSDPFAEERARLKAERDEIERNKRSSLQSQWGSFIDSTISETEAKVVEGFAWPEDMKAKYGNVLSTVNKDALMRVRKAVGNIPIAKQELDALVNRTQRNFRQVDQNQAKMEFTRTFLKYAKPIIARVRQEVLKESGVSLKPKQIVPTTTGTIPAKATSVAPSPSQPQARKPGQSFDDYANEIIMGALQ